MILTIYYWHYLEIISFNFKYFKLTKAEAMIYTKILGKWYEKKGRGKTV